MANIQGPGNPEGIKHTEGAKAASKQPSAEKVSKGFSNPDAQVVNPDKSSTGKVLAQGTNPDKSSYTKLDNGNYRTNIEGIGDTEITPGTLKDLYNWAQNRDHQQAMEGIVFIQKVAGTDKDLNVAHHHLVL